LLGWGLLATLFVTCPPGCSILLAVVLVMFTVVARVVAWCVSLR